MEFVFGESVGVLVSWHVYPAVPQARKQKDCLHGPTECALKVPVEMAYVFKPLLRRSLSALDISEHERCLSCILFLGSRTELHGIICSSFRHSYESMLRLLRVLAMLADFCAE